MGKMRHGFVIAVLTGVVVATAGCTDTAQPTSTANGTPTTSASVDTESPFGDLPVASYEAIPWDEIGPGWFVLEYHPDFVPSRPVDRDSVDLVPILVSPEGQMFATSPDNDVILHSLGAWTRDGVVVVGSTSPGAVVSDDAVYDLDTGDFRALHLSGSATITEGAADGLALGYWYEDSVLTRLHGVYDLSTNDRVVDLCTDDSESERGPLSPDGREVVCFVATDEGTTRVVLDGIGVERVVLAEFDVPYTDFVPRGWVGPDEFLYTRGSNDVPYVLDTATGSRTTTEVPENLQFTAFWQYYPELRAYLDYFDANPLEVGVYSRDGSLVARVECSTECVAAHSGNSVLIVDPKPWGTLGEGSTQGVTITLVDVRGRNVIEVFDGELTTGGFLSAYGHAEVYN